jgi:hypothetical protein
MSARKQLTPFVFITVTVILGMVALAGGALIIKSLEKQNNGIGATSIASQRVDDGSTITLHAVTYGASHRIDVSVLRPGAFIIFETGYRNRTLQKNVSGECVVVWFSRTDANGNAMDSNWWSHCSVTDLNGNEIVDSDAEQHTLSGWSHHRTRQQQDRRFQIQRNDTRHRDGNSKIVIANSMFPKIRSQGDITIKVFDITKKEVARFTVPNPTPQPTETWTAVKLPTETTIDDMTLRLNTFTYMTHKDRINNSIRDRKSLLTKFEMVDAEGKRNNEYEYYDVRFFDLLENQCQAYDAKLSFEEPVWRIEANAFRKDTAEFSTEEIVEFDPIPIPSNGTTMPLTLVSGNSRIQLQLRHFSGRGLTTYTYPVSRYSGSNIFSGGLGKTRFSLRQSTQNRLTSVTMSGDVGQVIHLRLDHRTVNPDERLTLLSVDDQGRAVPMQRRQMFDTEFCVMKVAPDAKTIQLKAILQDVKKFKFFVAPPKTEFTPPKRNSKRS